MGNSQSYVERMEDQQDVYGQGMPFGQGNPAKPMIEMSDKNRILISDQQAQLLNLVSLHHDVLMLRCRTTEGKKLFEAIGQANHVNVQTAQLTRDSMSREDYIKVAAKQAKKRGLLDIFSSKQSSNNAGEGETDGD
jgi:hypothetical protein